MSAPTAEELVASAERELDLRRRLYPAWIVNGKLTQAKADHELACQEAIVRLCQKHKYDGDLLGRMAVG